MIILKGSFEDYRGYRIYTSNDKNISIAIELDSGVTEYYNGFSSVEDAKHYINDILDKGMIVL